MPTSRHSSSLPREAAENLGRIRDAYMLAPEKRGLFSTSNFFQHASLAGALDELPAPETLRPLDQMISADSPFMKGRIAMADALARANTQFEVAAEVTLAIDTNAVTDHEPEIYVPRERG